MENWKEYASMLADSSLIACAVMLAISAVFYTGLRLFHLIPRFRRQHTWRTDLRTLRLIAPIGFLTVFLPSLFIAWLFSDLCGTSQNTEFEAPDRRHKIAIYAFDCGATTDFSLIVSLLDADDSLPKHKTAPVLYSRYHQIPVHSDQGSNFEVSWKSSQEVLVKIAEFDGTPLVKQDGVIIRFEPLR